MRGSSVRATPEGKIDCASRVYGVPDRTVVHRAFPVRQYQRGRIVARLADTVIPNLPPASLVALGLA
jgi:hypothetical protein